MSLHASYLPLQVLKQVILVGNRFGRFEAGHRVQVISGSIWIQDRCGKVGTCGRQAYQFDSEVTAYIQLMESLPEMQKLPDRFTSTIVILERGGLIQGDTATKAGLKATEA